MRTLLCRVGLYSEREFRRKRVVSRIGNVAVVREWPGRYSLVHVPTGLGVHPRLQHLSGLTTARTALALAAPLCTWDWDDPDYIMGLSRRATPLWDALVTIAEMAEAQ